MPAFTDSKGRSWSLTFTVSVIKRVRAECGVNLAELTGDEFRNYLAVAGDPIKLSEVLYAACQGQHPGVTLDDFQDAIADDVLHQAAQAFEDAFLNFCPSRQRAALSTLAAKAKEIEAEILKSAVSQLDAIYSPSVTSSPESSVSTPPT